MKKITLLCFALALTACSIIYRPDMQQGNLITPDMVSQLRIGMTPQEVRYILGTPVLSHSFDIHRWDYIYTYRKGTEPTDAEKLTLFFMNGHLAKITPLNKYTLLTP